MTIRNALKKQATTTKAIKQMIESAKIVNNMLMKIDLRNARKKK